MTATSIFEKFRKIAERGTADEAARFIETERFSMSLPVSGRTIIWSALLARAEREGAQARERNRWRPGEEGTDPATRTSSAALLRLLTENGLCHLSKLSYGQEPWVAAFSSGSGACAALWSTSASPNVFFEGETPLTLAASEARTSESALMLNAVLTSETLALSFENQGIKALKALLMSMIRAESSGDARQIGSLRYVGEKLIGAGMDLNRIYEPEQGAKKIWGCPLNTPARWLVKTLGSSRAAWTSPRTAEAAISVLEWLVSNGAKLSVSADPNERLSEKAREWSEGNASGKALAAYIEHSEIEEGCHRVISDEANKKRRL